MGPTKPIRFRLNGEDATVDPETEFTIDNPTADRARISALIAHWNAMVVAAEAALTRYNGQMVQANGAALTKVLEGDDKIAEWKAKAIVAGHPDTIRLANDLAAVEQTLGNAKAVLQGYTRKYNLLVGANGRDGTEWGSSADLAKSSESGDTQDPRFASFAKKRAQDRQKRQGDSDGR